VAAHSVRVLVLVDRELAEQGMKVFSRLRRNLPLRCHVALWRRAHRAADKQLRKGLDVLVATPAACSTCMPGRAQVRAVANLVLD